MFFQELETMTGRPMPSFFLIQQPDRRQRPDRRRVFRGGRRALDLSVSEAHVAAQGPIWAVDHDRVLAADRSFLH